MTNKYKSLFAFVLLLVLAGCHSEYSKKGDTVTVRVQDAPAGSPQLVQLQVLGEKIIRVSTVEAALETGAFPAEPFSGEDGNDAGAAPKILLIRAHGEPPRTYIQAGERGFKVVDFTCPVVLNIQKSIREAAERNAPEGQIVIFGKIGHAEVLGLVGQVDGKAVVIENSVQLEEALSDGRIDTSRHIDIFSQTTKSPVEYEQICNTLAQKMASPDLLAVHNTICRQVASRHRELAEFARSHDVVVFVSGRESSNGKVLSELCRSENARTYCIVDASGLDPVWFRPEDNVGVCGATSTPKWLLEEVASQIKNLH
jgi:4-hydroxy-3-methylbut-2-enyl diphosphate reductase